MAKKFKLSPERREVLQELFDDLDAAAEGDHELELRITAQCTTRTLARLGGGNMTRSMDVAALLFNLDDNWYLDYSCAQNGGSASARNNDYDFSTGMSHRCAAIAMVLCWVHAIREGVIDG